jgi:hypothetical protein
MCKIDSNLSYPLTMQSAWHPQLLSHSLYIISVTHTSGCTQQPTTGASHPRNSLRPEDQMASFSGHARSVLCLIKDRCNIVSTSYHTYHVFPQMQTNLSVRHPHFCIFSHRLHQRAVGIAAAAAAASEGEMLPWLAQTLTCAQSCMTPVAHIYHSGEVATPYTCQVASCPANTQPSLLDGGGMRVCRECTTRSGGG